MGLFSSKKSSTSTSTTNNYNDNRSVVDAGGGIVGSGNVITSTDGGAVKDALSFALEAQTGAAGFNLEALGRSFDLAGQAAANARGSSADALGFAREVVSGATSKIAEAYQTSSDTSSGNRTLQLAGLGLAAAAVLFFIVRR